MKHVVGVVVALPQEAYALFGRLGWSPQGGFSAKAERFENLLAMVVVCGQGQERSRQATHFLLKSDPLFVLNLGVAGALVESLRAGDLFVPRAVIHRSSELKLDSPIKDALNRLLRTQGMEFRQGLLCTHDAAVETPSEKADLHRSTGAEIVDMEAYGIASACSSCDVPLYVVKSVADSLFQSIPGAITSCLAETGHISFVRFTMTILSRPWLIPKLLEMQQSFKAALFSLEQVKSVFSSNLSKNMLNSR